MSTYTKFNKLEVELSLHQLRQIDSLRNLDNIHHYNTPFTNLNLYADSVLELAKAGVSGFTILDTSKDRYNDRFCDNERTVIVEIISNGKVFIATINEIDNYVDEATFLYVRQRPKLKSGRSGGLGKIHLIPVILD